MTWLKKKNRSKQIGTPSRNAVYSVPMFSFSHLLIRQSTTCDTLACLLPAPTKHYHIFSRISFEFLCLYSWVS